MSTTIEKEDIQIHSSLIDDINSLGGEHSIIAFNNDVTSFQSVVSVLCLSVPMSFSEAVQAATDIHTKGEAAVYIGAYSHCVTISEHLQAIGVKSEIQKIT